MIQVVTLGEEMRDIVTAMEADEEIGNPEEKEVPNIKEIAEVLERKQNDKLPAPRDIPKEKLEETTNIICKFEAHNITKTNELFYAGAVVATNRLGVKFNKVAERKESIWRRRLQNKMKELKKGLKVMSATFLLVYFLCLKKRTFETRKNFFNFTSKAIFVLEIIRF